jgi:hypothetical protein
VLNNDGVFNYAKAGSNGLSAKSLIITEGDLTFADGSTQSTASTPSTPSTWSSYPAISNIDAHFHAIDNISEFNLIDNVNNRQMLAYPFSLLLQNNGQATSTELYAPLSQNDNICFNTHNSNANASSIQMAVQPNNPTITLTGGANTSILSASAIQFNGVSLNSTVATNTGDIATNTADILTNNGLIATNTANIATNTANIATNTANIATNTTNIATNSTSITSLIAYQQRQTIVYNSPAIYADGQPPSAIPSAIFNQYGYQGWYFKNTSAGYKVNWYLPPDINMTLAQLSGFFFNILNLSTTSNDNTPFVSVYTKPTGSGDYKPWYHSKRTFIFDQSVTPVANTTYTAYLNNSLPSSPPHYNSTLVPLIVSTVAPFPTGDYLPNEQILFFSFGSNSASAVNSVEFILSSFNIVQSTGTQSFQFMKV